MSNHELGFNEKELRNTSQRIESDAELIRGGAGYVNSDGGPRLEIEARQIKEIETEHRLEEELQYRFPIGDSFHIIAESNPNPHRSDKQYEALMSTASIELPNRLIADNNHYRIIKIDQGMNGKVMTIEAAWGEGIEPDRHSRPVRYFYTDVLTDDKHKRLTLEERAKFLS